jgi:hypothetical protein
MSRYSRVEKDDVGNPVAWCQKIKGTWRRFPFVSSFHLNNTTSREQAAAEFEMIFPAVERNGILIEVDDVLYQEITEDFIPRWLRQKSKEKWLGGLDPDAFIKRSMTGFLGEAAMESFLGVPVLDRNAQGRIAVGDSMNFVGADLAKGTGLDIGIKSSERPNFPTPKRNVRRPQVICLKVGRKQYYMAGYASMKCQRECMDSRYILNDNLRNKRLYNGQIEKSAFWGFHRLRPFKTVEGLKALYYKHH